MGMLVGCIYEYPDDAMRPGTVALTVALTLNIEFEMEAGEEQFVQSHASLFDDGYLIRYIVDLYEPPAEAGVPPAKRLHHLMATDDALPPDGVYRFSETVILPAAPCIALVWIDFVRADDPRDFYYRTADLQAVEIDDSRPYRGYHVSKDAFTAGVSIDLTRESQNARVEATVPVKRPFALYRIITTDVAEYRNAPRGLPYAAVRPDTTHLYYPSGFSYFPMGYNVYASGPYNFDNSGVHYTCNVSATDEPVTEVELAADFVFVNGNETSYDVAFEICTPTGARISRHNRLPVTLRRNRLTVIRGAFLTTGNSSGGTGIDFNFDEEYVIQF
jgi:hypothetical protein